MKLYMKILVATVVISVLFSTLSFESACSELQNDVFRLHILANSDEEYDQNLKLYVRDTILDSCSSLYDDVKTKEDAKIITKNNLPLIVSTAQKAIIDKGYDYSVKACVTKKFFDTRYYENFTMPAGVYDTLQITIGEGKGKNWWCVMYPTLCVGAATDISMKEDLTDSEYEVIVADDVEYKFKIVEYFEKVTSFFSQEPH